jgi:16S rRNA G1207 methylase RsmC
MSEKIDKYDNVLDLGCGYGPIGISLKSFYPSSVIHMVDRDALALEFSRQNIELNNLNGFKVYGSLGYDDIAETDFDLIVSNIPAKVGEPVLSHILEDAKFYLRPGGKVVVVVIDAIGDFVTKVLKSNKDINILFYKRWPGHLVFHYEFIRNDFVKPKLNAFERGVYSRGKQDILIDNSEISIETAFGLAEFDVLSYETEMILDKLGDFKDKEIEKAVIFNPEQGIIAIAVPKNLKVKEINLVDRDLEALRVSRKNLIANGFSSEEISLFHQVGLRQTGNSKHDFIVGALDEKDDSKIHTMLLKEASEMLSKDGMLLLASGSTPITRLESLIKREKILKVVERQKSKRKSLIVLKNRD